MANKADRSEKGMVYLTGAGPGDPELLTLKAKRVLGEADVIIYDSLIFEEIMSYAKKGAEVIYAGKRSSDHTLPQYSINELLAEKAKENKIVVRLKGGDPYLFGRGGEEAERLAKDNIPFEVIPGISSSFAVPSYAGIPLTHRDYASTVAIVTGHEGEHKDKSTIDWNRLAGADTMVVLMGYKNLDSITGNIINAGKSKDTPCAVIQEGTTLNQKVATGTLSDINEAVKKEGLKSPLILIVGNVVKLRGTLNWFERRPLSGLKVMVTRPESQAGTLPVRLRNLGAFVINLPLIKTLNKSPDIDAEKISRAINNIDKYDYLIFTSVNGVRCFLEEIFSMGSDVRSFSDKKIISVGKVTSQELNKHGIIPDLEPNEFSQAGITKTLKQKKIDLKNKRILFPQALKINSELPDFLVSSGARVENLAVYETVKPEESIEKMKEVFRPLFGSDSLFGSKKVSKNIGLPEDFDFKSLIITFTSYSTVENFVSLAEDIQKGFIKSIIDSGVKFASIGQKTAEYARNLGINCHIIARNISIDSLIEGIKEFYNSNKY